jgi:hypothetical protein
VSRLSAPTIRNAYHQLDTKKRLRQDTEETRTYKLIGMMPANMRPRNVDVLGLTKKELADWLALKKKKEAGKKQLDTKKELKKEADDKKKGVDGKKKKKKGK